MIVVAYKTLNGTWKALKRLPDNKYILTFKTSGDAVEFIKDYNELIERILNEYPGLKIVKLKYIREVVRDFDVVEEYKVTAVEVAFLKEWQEKNIKKKENREKEIKDMLVRKRMHDIVEKGR